MRAVGLKVLKNKYDARLVAAARALDIPTRSV
jgi:hypothetical protein